MDNFVHISPWSIGKSWTEEHDGKLVYYKTFQLYSGKVFTTSSSYVPLNDTDDIHVYKTTSYCKENDYSESSNSHDALNDAESYHDEETAEIAYHYGFGLLSRPLANAFEYSASDVYYQNADSVSKSISFDSIFESQNEDENTSVDTTNNNPVQTPEYNNLGLLGLLLALILSVVLII